MKNTSHQSHSKLPLFCFALIIGLALSTHCAAQHKLYTKTISVFGPKENEKRDSTFVQVVDDLFEIGLYSMNQGEKFRAQRNIERSKLGEEFRMVTLYLATEDGNNIYFKDSQEFIDYMTAHGYDMVTETKQRFRTDYTFKKK